jgi:hypothetical protein
MSSSSMLYTVGIALSRAADNGYPVAVLVEGSWIRGQVVANDGTGVVLECTDGGHCVVKVERIAAVTVQAESPMRAAGAYRGSIGDGHQAWEAPTPMPGPRPVYV